MSATTTSLSVKTDQEIIDGFEQDGFRFIKKVEYQGRRGFEAHSLTATNTITKQPKKAFYVEGSSYEMGYLFGLMAFDDVEQMAVKFESEIIPTMIHKTGFFANLISRILMGVVRRVAWKQRDVLPRTLWNEINGLRDACRKSNPRSKVGVKRLLALNMGIDILMAAAYDPESFLFRRFGLKPADVRTDHIGCNGFCIFGKGTADGKHYMGRDFMFPTGGVFQDVACMVIYNPDDTETINGRKRNRLPTLCMTAPGFAGSIAALNENGVGVGVDMLPGANDSIKRPGLNSLLLVRHTADFAESAADAVEIMTEAPRGVSWLYLIGDGKHQKAVVLEAGINTEHFDPFEYPDRKLFDTGLLPSASFFKEYAPETLSKGLVARWSDYEYPTVFLTANPALFQHYDKTFDMAMMDEASFINPGFKSGSYTEPGKVNDNNPKSFYFAPQRETRDDMILVTNMAITPTMRLPGMHEHTAAITGEDALSQMQWRYDALNKELLINYGTVDETKAWDIITFLRPNHSAPYPKFYGHHRTPAEIKDVLVRGSTSLMNLTDLTMKSLYGYYGDKPVSLSLQSYID